MSRVRSESNTTKQVEPSSIEVSGADVNNLKNVDVVFPLKKISVVTGVSGSGKSSLLADTLAAEGSRRTRMFLGTSQQELERDDVRAFVGRLPPTILVGQRGFRATVRTTVGTATGFLSVLRRLFVLASAPYSERAKGDVPPPSPESYAIWIAKHYRGPAKIWAAPIRQQRTDGVAAVKRLASNSIKRIIVYSETDPPRLRESGRAVEVSEFKGLNANVAHTIEALIGTVEVFGSPQTKQLQGLLRRAFDAGDGSVVITLPNAVDNPDLAGPFGPRLDSKKHWVHPDAPDVFSRPSVHLLSFNAPEHEASGACRACGGTGIERRLRESVLISHPDRAMRDGAFAIWTEKNYKYVNVQHETIEGLRGMRGFSPDVPWSRLPASAHALVLNGSGGEPIFDRERTGRKFGAARPFAGFRKIILEKSAAGTTIADQLADYVEAGPCESCDGTRWSFQARALRVGGHGIAEILRMTFTEVAAFSAAGGDFAKAVPSATLSLIEAIRRHGHSIVSVGLGYLTGDRGMLDVSEGESRRIRLARVLDAGERGLCLLLDEPARGLHESDLSELARSLERLRGEHTIILNEHRERLWDIADFFVEVGPGAGASGGEVTYAGPRRIHEDHDDRPLRTSLPVPANQPKITIRAASIHNLENVDCEIPIGRFTCISGVSGSGKSSFVRGVLTPALLKAVGGVAPDFALRQGRWRSVNGTGLINEVVALDQTMPPPNRRSLVATFADVFDDIRKVFGTSPAARRDGLSESDFGVNAGHGRCPVCVGVGEVADGDLWSVCPACGGSRYGHAALSVRIDGTNVHELLQMPVEHLGTCAERFRIPQRLIAAMCDLGIGYVALGRRIDTLSGGEVQRLRLAMRLGSVSTESMFFILDEPAVGLHPRDVRRLAVALERILDGGRNTMVIVEHDLRLIRSADWVLEFGPGSGPDGGKIIFAGLPEQLARTRTPTGLALAGKLPARKRTREAAEHTITKRKLPLSERMARTTALMRTLISGDAPATLASDDGLAEPIVSVSERFWSGRDGWEVAGLDLEIPKLLLDVQRTASGDVFAELLADWKEYRDSSLVIQPFLTEMQVWGTELPQSVVRAVSSHVLKEGLRLVTTGGQAVENGLDVRQVRATGERLVPEGDSDEAHLRVLRDAFGVGAGYVELRDHRGRLRARASNRLLNLDTAVIAPMVPVPSHFSRFDPQGRCPMCKGSRGVGAIPDALVIGDRNATPDSERFLTPEANTVMKGVRQNELNPFLRRLAKEGLWELKTSFEQLDRAKRDIILFGFWSRPGAGSFLKTPRANPAEVASWLRWDGLYRRVHDQADRSHDAEWLRRVRENTRVKTCLLCGGSGMRRFASLLKVGGTSFSEWVGLSNPGRMVEQLRKMEVHTSRQRRTRERILYCLAPLAKSRTSVEQVVERSVESFTTMTAARCTDLGEN
jgi:excinuclease ABC A subunit